MIGKKNCESGNRADHIDVDRGVIECNDSASHTWFGAQPLDFKQRSVLATPRGPCLERRGKRGATRDGNTGFVPLVQCVHERRPGGHRVENLAWNQWVFIELPVPQPLKDSEDSLFPTKQVVSEISEFQ